MLWMHTSQVGLKELTWEGRQLKSYFDGDYTTTTYGYNADGIRTFKEVYNDESGETTRHEYILSGSQIIKETVFVNDVESYTLVYLYDESGAPLGYRYRTPSYASGVFDGYFFEKNLQGDIIAVYNQSGTKLISYNYDAWGVTTVAYLNGGGSTAARFNPFRYRGYYFDSETNLYYLQSRYYNPTWGRFISADGVSTLGATPSGLADKNLFAYCDNNPVMRYDNGGDFWHVLIGAAVGAVANFAISVATDLISGEEIDWCDAAVSAGVGFVSGGLSAMGVPAGVLIGVNAGLSAAESVYSDIKENICDNGDNSVGDIVFHAVINAGVSTLFTAAGGASNGRELSAMYKSSRAAKQALKLGGLAPSVKQSMNKAISTYSKALGKFTKDCLLSAVTESPISTFSSWYAGASYDYLVKGPQ